MIHDVGSFFAVFLEAVDRSRDFCRNSTQSLSACIVYDIIGGIFVCDHLYSQLA